MKTIISGSLSCIISLLIITAPRAALAASSNTELNGIAEPVEVSQIDASKGIVRIRSGTNDEDGHFSAKNTFSGFVVSSDDNGGVYIVTTWHAVDVGQNAVIQVTVKNDTTENANIESYSEEQDFCILSASNMKGKAALPLRIPEYESETAKDTLNKGSTVRSLGFRSKASSGTEFSASDVTVNEGTVKDLDYEKDSAEYIKHTALIDKGMDGGPLVDENGYVIGINNLKKSGRNTYNALQIIEADKLLDSNVIKHQTRDKDALYGALYTLCDDSIGNLGKVSSSDKAGVTESIKNAIKVMEESPYDRSALQSAYDELNTAVSSAELKTPKSLIMIIVLGALIIVLAIRLITLVRWNQRYEQEYGISNDITNDELNDKRKNKTRNTRKEAHGNNKARTAGVQAGVRKAISTADTTHATGAKLIVRRTGAEYEIDKNIFTMGRSEEADVTIADNIYIARMHAMIENRKGVYYLHDMGTKNGTYLNGRKVEDEGIRLVSQDIIGLGNEELEFR